MTIKEIYSVPTYHNTVVPQGWSSEHVNPYIPTQTPRGRIKWPYATTMQTAHFMHDLISDLVICMFRKKAWLYMTPDILTETQVSLNNTNPTHNTVVPIHFWLICHDSICRTTCHHVAKDLAVKFWQYQHQTLARLGQIIFLEIHQKNLRTFHILLRTWMDGWTVF